MKTQYIVKAVVVLGMIVAGALIGSADFGGTGATGVMSPPPHHVESVASDTGSLYSQSGGLPYISESNLRVMQGINSMMDLAAEVADYNTSPGRLAQIGAQLDKRNQIEGEMTRYMGQNWKIGAPERRQQAQSSYQNTINEANYVQQEAEWYLSWPYQ